MSHLGEPGQGPDPAPAWGLMPRSAGPYGSVIASAADVVRPARMHLDGGLAPDGTRVPAPETVAAMQGREADCPDKWAVASEGWGLGWTLYDWAGTPGYGHDGASTGQYAYLRVVPEAGVRMPEPFAPAAQPPAVDIAPYVGTYRRAGVASSPSPNARARRALSPPLDMDLVPVSETVFAANSFSEDWMPVVFATLPQTRERGRLAPSVKAPGASYVRPAVRPLNHR